MAAEVTPQEAAFERSLTIVSLHRSAVAILYMVVATSA
jgi:hypothetical protein